MYPKKNTLKEMFSISSFDWALLTKFRKNPISQNVAILFLIGTFGTFITLIGMLLGFVRAYKRLDNPRNSPPVLHPLSPQSRVAMVIGGLGIWLVIVVVAFLLYQISGRSLLDAKIILTYFFFNLIFMAITFKAFKNWAVGYSNWHLDSLKFGSARWATHKEMRKYLVSGGLYVGGNYVFKGKGHILTVGGSRSGKGTNLIVPNLLGVGNPDCSFVVIDPKGENASICVRQQRMTGKNVVVLNPWRLLQEQIGETSSFNPLDLLADMNDINLVDDAQTLAEMLVPIEKNDRDKFFTDTARSIISGLIVHIVVNYPKEERNLVSLWQLLRTSEDQWIDMLAEMATTDEGPNARIVISTAEEIRKLMATGERTFGIILATMLQSTDFIKSPALQESLKSGYNPYDLTDGKTTLYIIIPVDKLQSHARWLRIISTACMRAVIRKPNKRVVMILDEFASLGYMTEIENALATYAGYNLTLWPIIQSLVQLKGHYPHTWESFIGNSVVKQFISIRDNFSAKYISEGLGATSHVLYKRNWFRVTESVSTPRLLLTPSEIMIGTEHKMIAMIGDNHPTYFWKVPYYEMQELIKDGKPIYDKNPYIKVEPISNEPEERRFAQGNVEAFA